MPPAALRSVPSLAARYATTSAHSGKHKVVVIGAGAGGLAAANQIYNTFKSRGESLNDGDIAIIDPAQYHDYQPGWTIVGSGLADKADYRRSLSSLIPAHFAHIPGSAAGVEPQSSKVVLADGTSVGYESLVVAAGIQLNFDKIAGLQEALADSSSKVATIYSYETADKTWDLIRDFDGKGEAIFTQPFGPVKCAGGEPVTDSADDSSAKDRIYGRLLLEVHPKSPHSLLHHRHAHHVLGTPLLERAQHSPARKGHSGRVQHQPRLGRLGQKGRYVRGARRGQEGDEGGEGVWDAARRAANGTSGLDQEVANSRCGGMGGRPPGDTTAQQVREHLFAGRFVQLANVKSELTRGLADQTAAAITAQAPVLSHNLVSLLSTGKVGDAIYDGYTSCPLFTGRGELMLAEFKYGLERKETFGWLTDQSKPNRAFYHLTKDVFPRTYFSKMLKGEWFGPKGVIPPVFPA